MNALLYRIQIETTKAPEFIDLTQQVREFVRDSRVRDGFCLVYSQHTTAAIRINENEPCLLKDMESFLERMASRNGHYMHNDFSIRAALPEGELPNGHAHCQQLFLGASETIPVISGQLHVGQWQSIFLVELDRPRPREVLVQILGD